MQETTGYKMTAVHRGLGQDALNAGVYPATVLADGERSGVLFLFFVFLSRGPLMTLSHLTTCLHGLTQG